MEQWQCDNATLAQEKDQAFKSSKSKLETLNDSLQQKVNASSKQGQELAQLNGEMKTKDKKTDALTKEQNETMKPCKISGTQSSLSRTTLGLSRATLSLPKNGMSRIMVCLSTMGNTWIN